MQMVFGDDATLEDPFSVWAHGLLDEEFGWGVSHEQFLGLLETHKCNWGELGGCIYQQFHERITLLCPLSSPNRKSFGQPKKPGRSLSPVFAHRWSGLP
jgi:hypothetical protein